MLNAIIYQSIEKGWSQIVYRIDSGIYRFQNQEKSTELVIDYIKQNEKRIGPEKSEIIYTGEIPWCNLYLENENEEYIRLTNYYHLSQVEYGFDRETYIPSKDLCNFFNLLIRTHIENRDWNSLQ